MNAFQDHYPENVAHCCGCARLNKNGHQIKTEWDGDETVTRNTPQPYETSVPQVWLLPLCIARTGAIWTRCQRFDSSRDRCMWTTSNPRRSTGRSSFKEIKGRKVIVETSVLAGGVTTAHGEVVAVQMPESFGAAPTF